MGTIFDAHMLRFWHHDLAFEYPTVVGLASQLRHAIATEELKPLRAKNSELVGMVFESGAGALGSL